MKRAATHMLSDIALCRRYAKVINIIFLANQDLAKKIVCNKNYRQESKLLKFKSVNLDEDFNAEVQ